jgi:hypothetical protein
MSCSNPVVGLRGGLDNRQQRGCVKPDGAGQDNQFDDINPALTTLKTRHQRLVALEPVRQIILTEASRIARVDQRLAERHLTLASDCSRHAPHTFCDVASG